MIVLALFKSRLRPWLERQASKAPEPEGTPYANAARREPQVADRGVYSGDALRSQLPDCRDVVGSTALLVDKQRYALFSLSVGSEFDDYVSFAVILDGPRILAACVLPHRGPTP